MIYNMTMLFDTRGCSNNASANACNTSEVRFDDLTDDEKIEVELLAAHLEMKVAIFILVIFIIGTLGNLLFLLLVIRVRDMRTVTNFYLANVAVADMVYLILETSGTITELRRKNIPFDSNFECALFYFIRHLSFFGSMLLITLVSLERYIAVCHPLHHQYMKNKWRSLLFTTLTWFAAGVLAIFVTLKYSKVKYVCVTQDDSKIFNFCFGQNFHFCDPLHPMLADVANIVKGMPFLISAILNTVFYAFIIRRLRKPIPNSKDVSDRYQKRVSERDKKRRQIVIMLVANSVIYFICLTPGQIVIWPNLSFFGKPLLDHTHVFEKHILYMVIMLNVLNSAVNPIIYGVASPGYRRGFLKALALKSITTRVEPPSVNT